MLREQDLQVTVTQDLQVWVLIKITVLKLKFTYLNNLHSQETILKGLYAPFFIFISKQKTMVLYNVTVKVDHEIHIDWIQWLREEHIPEVMGTGKFKESKLFKIMTDTEEDGVTYSVQYFAESMTDYFDYINDHANEMRRKGKEKWGEKFVAFRTVLKEVI